MIDGHQELPHTGPLLATLGGQLVGASLGGSEGDLVVLRTPTRFFAVDHDLATQDAVDPFLYRSSARLCFCVIDERVVADLVADIAQ